MPQFLILQANKYIHGMNRPSNGKEQRIKWHLS
jgi:hypothetical protein